MSDLSLPSGSPAQPRRKTNNRDDFPPDVRRNLAKRVGQRCYNPGCQKTTSGPRDDPERSVDIGVAAHVTAAASGGPRYDASLSSQERKCAKNGLWLCQNCAKMVDNDPERYTAEVLLRWKEAGESRALAEVEGAAAPDSGQSRHRAVLLLSGEVDRLSQEVSSVVGKDLDRVRAAYREGRNDEVLEWLREVKANRARWDALTPQLKARVLRLEAHVELGRTGDAERAKAVAEEARREAPQESDALLRAVIEYVKACPEAAIALLDEQDPRRT